MTHNSRSLHGTLCITPPPNCGHNAIARGQIPSASAAAVYARTCLEALTQRARIVGVIAFVSATRFALIPASHHQCFHKRSSREAVSSAPILVFLAMQSVPESCILTCLMMMSLISSLPASPVTGTAVFSCAGLWKRCINDTYQNQPSFAFSTNLMAESKAKKLMVEFFFFLCVTENHVFGSVHPGQPYTSPPPNAPCIIAHVL